MINPSSGVTRALARLAALLLAASACGGAGAECSVVPCPLPLAVEITVTGAAGGEPVPGASVAVTGAVTGGEPCQGSVCRVLGPAGTYEVDVSAAGYQTVHRRVVVPGDSPDCGCPTAEAQRVTVTLPAAG